jgi:hypothetical protein
MQSNDPAPNCDCDAMVKLRKIKSTILENKSPAVTLTTIFLILEPQAPIEQIVRGFNLKATYTHQAEQRTDAAA